MPAVDGSMTAKRRKPWRPPAGHALSKRLAEQRRRQLLFQIAQHYERSAELAGRATPVCGLAWRARASRDRVLERCGQPDAAFGLGAAG